MIREWHIVISGFRQQSGTLNGMARLWLDMSNKLAPRHEATVQLREWHDDFSNLAETIQRVAALNGEPPVVNVYGYSWGGMSAVKFARELHRRGIDVNHMVLCDAVYRHWYWLGNWRAFVPWRSLLVPSNVKTVTQFRQKQNLPRGHKVKAVNPGRTRVGAIRWLTAEHCWMDDQPAFQLACLTAAQNARQVA